MNLRSLFQLWRARPVLSSAFLLACALSLFFAGRLVFFTIYWSNPEHQNESLKPWMTVGYIARSWHLDAPEIDTLAGLPGPQERGHPMTLTDIARARGVPVAEVMAEVEAALAALVAAKDAAKAQAPAP